MRFRLYPTPEQATVLADYCATARFVWNLGLEQRNLYRPEFGPTPSYVQQSQQLTEARSDSWLGESPRIPQEQALRNLDRAFQRWWAGRRGRPTWRKQGVHESFCISGDGRPFRVERLNRRWGAVTVPKLGAVKFRWTRTPPDTKTYVIRCDPSGLWWVAFLAKPAPLDGPGDGSIIGLDRGVATSVATSEGELLSIPRERAIRARAQQRLARCRKGSHRRARRKQETARAYAREADRRRDWIEKTSTDLARRYDLIRVEDLRIPNMTRKGRGKRGLNREILASGWGELVRRIEDKAPGRVEKVNPAYTSQTCSVCGHVASESRESQARFCCVACGHCEHADVNAARNIAGRHSATARGGLKVGSLSREPHRDSLPVESVA